MSNLKGKIHSLLFILLAAIPVPAFTAGEFIADVINIKFDASFVANTCDINVFDSASGTKVVNFGTVTRQDVSKEVIVKQISLTISNCDLADLAIAKPTIRVAGTTVSGKTHLFRDYTSRNSNVGVMLKDRNNSSLVVRTGADLLVADVLPNQAPVFNFDAILSCDKCTPTSITLGLFQSTITFDVYYK